MSSVGDDILLPSFLIMLLGLPIALGAFIISLPLCIVAIITQAAPITIIKSVLIFAVATLCVRLFSKYQILENGIWGLLSFAFFYIQYNWHPVFCIVIGASVIIALCELSKFKVFYWIKTIVFSIINTWFIYYLIYAENGLYPAQDKIWAITFFIVFLVENLYIRSCFFIQHYNINYKKREQKQSGGSTEHKSNYSNDQRENTYHSNQSSFSQYVGKTEPTKWFSGVTNTEELKKRYHELMKIYHPDNKTGDVNISQQIKSEYDVLFKQYDENQTTT